MTQKYYLLKRDLYECPDHQGYTGIRDKAGVFSALELGDAEVMPGYCAQYGGHYAVKASEAPEFTKACFEDLKLAHILATKDAEIERLREASEWTVKSMCEGFCNDLPEGFYNADLDGDCAVCKLRAALSPDPAGGMPVEVK